MNPTDSQYTSTLQQVQVPHGHEALPLTGLDVFIVVAVAFALVLTGLVLRRAVSRDDYPR